MVTKNQIKLINSLSHKKQRIKNKLFIAESYKVISEFLDSEYELVQLFSTNPEQYTKHSVPCTEVNDTELAKLSQLSSPNTSIATFRIPQKNKPIQFKSLTLALDTINDPGNMGTIIRLCDWFDIKNIICSKETTDIYNPKVVQSTMGSLARVNIYYTDLNNYLNETKSPVYGTFMEGENIYKSNITSNGIIVMGNEANGITQDIEKHITEKISIPRFGNSKTESLNVATATAIVLSESKRHTLT